MTMIQLGFVSFTLLANLFHLTFSAYVYLIFFYKTVTFCLFSLSVILSSFGFQISQTSNLWSCLLYGSKLH